MLQKRDMCDWAMMKTDHQQVRLVGYGDSHKHGYRLSTLECRVRIELLFEFVRLAVLSSRRPALRWLTQLSSAP